MPKGPFRIPWIYVLGRWGEKWLRLVVRVVPEGHWGKTSLLSGFSFGKRYVILWRRRIPGTEHWSLPTCRSKSSKTSTRWRIFLRIEIAVPRWFVVSFGITPASEQNHPVLFFDFCEEGRGENFVGTPKREWSYCSEQDAKSRASHKPRQAKESSVHVK